MTNPIYNHIEVEKIILELSEARAKGEDVTPYLRQLQESVVEVIEENDTGTDDAVNQAVESLWAKILDLILKGELDPDDIPDSLRYQGKPPHFSAKLTTVIASAGNAPLDKVVRNVKAIHSLFGASHQVIPGSSCGIGKPHTEEGMSAHGKSGLSPHTDEFLDTLVDKNFSKEYLVGSPGEYDPSAAYMILADRLEKGTKPWVYSATSPSTTFALALMELDRRLRKASGKSTRILEEILAFQNGFSKRIAEIKNKEQALQVNEDMAREKGNEELTLEARRILCGEMSFMDIIDPDTLKHVKDQIDRGMLRGIEVVGGVLPLSIQEVLDKWPYVPLYIGGEDQKKHEALLKAGKITQQQFDLRFPPGIDKNTPTRRICGNSGPFTPTVSFNILMDYIAAILLFRTAEATGLPVVNINAILSNYVILPTNVFEGALEAEKEFKHRLGISDDSEMSVLDYFHAILHHAHYTHRIPSGKDSKGNKIDYNLVHDVFSSMSRLYPDLFQYKQVNVEFDNKEDPEYRQDLRGMMGVRKDTDEQIHHYLLEIAPEKVEKFTQLLVENISCLSRLRLAEKYGLRLSVVFPKRQQAAARMGGSAASFFPPQVPAASPSNPDIMESNDTASGLF